MSSHLVQAISETPIFEGLPPERVGRVAAIFTVRTYERGEQILGPHDPTDRTFVMAAGTARSSRSAADGRAIAVGLLDPGDVFGRLPFSEGTVEERVEALDRCVVLRAAAGDVERLLLDEPAIAVAALAGFARRVRESEQRLESLAFHQVPARLARTILDLADRYGKMTPVGVRIDLRVTHGQLAELVATTRETLTKVAGWLRGEGIVTLERRQIRIHDYQALEDVAEGVRVMPGRTHRAAA